MIKVTPLFSGSKGNSTLIQTEHTNLLLDAGCSYKLLASRLAQSGVYPKDISAVVVTHEHTDHISALKTWFKINRETKVFAPQACANSIMQYSFCSQVFHADGGFDLGDVHVSVYACSHDSRACFGYKFADKDGCVASVTDTGIAGKQLVEFLRPCQTVLLESNHDVDMLWYGPYPAALKRRIASDFGHLSNLQAAEVLKQLVGSNVQKVVLAHLSEQNNTKQAALKAATQALGSSGIQLYVADQYHNEVSL